MAGPRKVLEILLRHYGPQGWWPAESRFEVVVGALLMAQTTWRNVEASIRNLREAGALDPHRIAEMSVPRLRALVRPAGLHQTKPRRLRAFCRHLVRTTDGDLGRFLGRSPEVVRTELLALDGIGPETADSILLYAGEAARFVVDAYTLRIGKRIGWFGDAGYDEAQEYLEARLPRDLERYREAHALLVALAKDVCRTRPRCGACPLRSGCAHGRRSQDRKRVGSAKTSVTFK